MRTHLRRGMTLMELITVLVIVGSMLAMVLPRFKISPRQTTQAMAFQIAQDLELVRTRALSTRANTRICFQDGARGWGSFMDHDRDGIIAENDTERTAAAAFGHRDLPQGVSYGRGSAPPAPNDAFGHSNISYVNHWVEFDTRGLLTERGQTATIYLVNDSDPTAVNAVQLSPAGSVRIWTWMNNQWQ
jgi:prepilin-type N-terminal cleavage/methylation domain-containing protein